jgi:hypothetical protein
VGVRRCLFKVVIRSISSALRALNSGRNPPILSLRAVLAKQPQCWPRRDCFGKVRFAMTIKFLTSDRRERSVSLCL